VAGACHNTGSNCRSRGGIPVDSRSGGGHSSSGVSDAGFTLCVKVFHFLDACPSPHPTTHNDPQGQVIQTGSSRRGHPGQVTCQKHTELVFCFYFVSQVT
jgi:hypothetical protein